MNTPDFHAARAAIGFFGAVALTALIGGAAMVVAGELGRIGLAVLAGVFLGVFLLGPFVAFVVVLVSIGRALAVCFLPAAMLACIAGWITPVKTQPIPSLVAAGLGCFAGGLVLLARWTRTRRGPPERPVCICGYPNAGLPRGSVCPECGEAFENGTGELDPLDHWPPAAHEQHD